MKGILALVTFTCIGFVICISLLACDEAKTSPPKQSSPFEAKSPKKSAYTQPFSDTTHSSDKDSAKGKLERVFYPQMSFCGGALEGIYSNDELIRIESTYGYDMGYSEKNIDFKDGRITKIEYRQHYADWDKYNERYGAEEGDIDHTKMTYFDTLYIIKFQPKRECSIFSGKKEVQGVVSKELIQRLLDCTSTMQMELSTVRSKN